MATGKAYEQIYGFLYHHRYPLDLYSSQFKFVKAKSEHFAEKATNNTRLSAVYCFIGTKEARHGRSSLAWTRIMLIEVALNNLQIFYSLIVYSYYVHVVRIHVYFHSLKYYSSINTFTFNIGEKYTRELFSG